MSLDRDHAALAIERVRRTWPAGYARDLAELPGRELEVVLELALVLDAHPVDPDSLLPIDGDPLRPSRAGARPRFRGVPPQDLPGAGGAKPGPPADLVAILDRFDEQPAQLELDADAAAAGALEGQRRALTADRAEQWKHDAAAWLARQPAGATFTADELVAAVGLPDESTPAANNAVGAWIAVRSRDGRLSWTGELRKSERVIGHGNLQRVWQVVPTAAAATLEPTTTGGLPRD